MKQSAFPVEVHVVVNHVPAPFHDYYIGHCWPASWPTMLGLLTIISDAIAAAPWWGDGEARVKVPAVGSVWADFECDPPDIVSVDSVDDDGTIWLWSMGRDYAWSGCLDRFLRHYRPATVVPTPTADDWIDPAVRLPDVGEWFWWDYGDGDISAYVHVDGDRDWRPGSRWAPILVGPPPIPDASEVE
jgi:hypothetical protein